MAYPNAAAKLFSFLGFAAASPTSPLPGTSMDTEFGEVRRAISEIVAYLESSHFDATGDLKSLTVNLEQLDATLVLALFGEAVPDLSAYETEIGVARDDANTAKTAAETAETNAETAETNAETAETNAAASAAAAVISAAAAVINANLQATDTTGSAGAYLVATPGALASFIDGHAIVAIANHSNTGAATLDVDGTGAVDWKKIISGSAVALVTGDIVANQHYLTIYDDSLSAWICVNPGSGTQPLDATLTSLAAVAGVAGDILYASGTDVWARLAKGNNGEVLKLASGIPAWAAALARETAIATTSGTAHGWTGIAAGANRITIIPNGVSMSGTDHLLIQIGDSGGYETASYTSGSFNTDGTAVTRYTSTSGFIVGINDAARAVHGNITLTREDGNKWVSSHSVELESGESFGGGSKTLSAELDRIQITRTGSNTFDAGSVNIFVEV